MRISKRALIAVFVAATAALSIGLAAGAFGAPGKSQHANPTHGAKRHGVPLIKASLAPSQPTDPMFHGVSPGTLPWVLKFGKVRVKRDGHLDLRVAGLIIPSLGTPGPVTSISAALYCGADTDMTAAGTTPNVPLSMKGDARIHDTSFDVPPTCLAPVILVKPHGAMIPPTLNLYIAVDGGRP
jgi:hypothetical protein